MPTDIDRLRELFSLAAERYRKEMQATVQMVAAEEPDSEVLARQRELERQAYEHFHDALLAYLAVCYRDEVDRAKGVGAS